MKQSRGESSLTEFEKRRMGSMQDAASDHASASAQRIMHGQLMTIAEVAAYLRLSKESLYKYVQRGVIPAVKIGRHWRFDKAALNAWVATQSHQRAPAGPSAARGAEVSQAPSTGMDVLVVDDDAAIRGLLEVWIREEGHEVATAVNGAQAMAQLTGSTFDLVFLDLQMPDITGGQVLGRLQEYDNRPPVVLITGHPGTSLMDQALHYDLLYVLSKPFGREQVVRLLRLVDAARLMGLSGARLPASSSGADTPHIPRPAAR